VGLFEGQDDAVARTEHDSHRWPAAALGSAGRFIAFTVVGNRAVSVLITARSHVIISVETVQFDPRDTGDDELPYGGLYDF
jgi:hypothetical protein